MFLSFSSSSYDLDGSAHHPFSSPGAPPELYHEANGGLLPFPSSFPPAEYYDLHRSSSSQSLPLHHYAPDPPIHHYPPPPPSYSSPPSSSGDYLDFHAAPVRRVLSTGDIQRTHGSVENYGQEGGGAPGRVGRYSAEERKERIERYRSKRNQRNFHKKITYACRKTLADSRPRVRGRFARNGETEAEMEAEMAAAGANSYISSGVNQSFEVCDGGGNAGGEWWSQMRAALATDDEEELYYDGDVFVSFADDDVFAMNILS
ncbi:two-component response regulator-like PRR1 [Zingiber officinale]|uniref:two-component response regulator-like PRR1 n=1 Tax=Zingiber officinale TaxID=94328 RepID=UPI001C4B72EC|nr:two-component response regulator-like PRR1 [Zingiber officinale]